MDIDKVKIYRITHIENIPHILQHGIAHKDSPDRNQNYRNIGDKSLIDTRNKREVSIDNGEIDLENNNTSIILGDYIPFYFGVRMPMLYVAQHGGNFVDQATSPEDIIYLACSLNKLILSDIDFYFTDGHATDMLTSFYDKTKINELVNIIDWSAIKSSYWGGDENLNVKRKKQAELLISGDVPLDLIIGFGCYSESARNKIISMGVTEEKVKIIPNAYY